MGRENLEKLTNFLQSWQGEDITEDKMKLIEYLVKLTQSDIDELFSTLKQMNIVPELYEGTYNKIKELINYHGFENNNYVCLSNFLRNREVASIKLSDIPTGKTFSVIDLCLTRLNYNRSLVNKLINMTDIVRGNVMGKFEVLLAIVLSSGKLPDKMCTGDILVGEESIEIKCSKSHGKKFSKGNVMSGAGKIGVKDGNGFKNVDGVRQFLYNKYIGLPDVVTLKPDNPNTIDQYILDAFNTKEYVVHAYKELFLNFFYGDALDIVSTYVDEIVNYFVAERSLEQMRADRMVINPDQYRVFRRMIGCMYLNVYQKMQKFSHILITSFNPVRYQDASVFVSNSMLQKHPMELYKDIEASGLDFCWQGLDKKAGRRVLMGAAVITA